LRGGKPESPGENINGGRTSSRGDFHSKPLEILALSMAEAVMFERFAI